MREVIKVRKLYKTVGKRDIISNLNFTVKEKEIYGFIGKNGSGKTTTIKLITGLWEKTSGSIKINGKSNLVKERKKIGTLIEEPVFYKNMTGYQNLVAQKKIMGIKKNSDEILKLLELVDLKEVSKKKVKQYSLGMKQRLGIAIALLGDPKILILDEPINGLDPIGVRFIRDLILKLNREFGITFFISSHILSELEKCATRYCIIEKGRIIEEISSQELKRKLDKTFNIKVSSEEKKKTEKILKEYQYEFIEKNSEFVLYNIDNGKKIILKLLMEGIIPEYYTFSQKKLEDYFFELIGDVVNE